VENSWGDKFGDKGYDIMTDAWFNEFTFEVVVHQDFITKEELAIYQREPVSLKPWDPMGALAK
jgi:bleomycin hydrolase